MLKRFTHTMERIEGQISKWSAPSSLVSESGSGQLRYLVAVSGGADSMCLADLCLRYLGAERFAVAHCNFHLRGEESDGDREHVESWAGANGIQIFIKDFDTERHALEHGISIEMAARELRYGWFAQLCAEHGFCGVMTAHNANDNAETLFLNLLRGTGLHGIVGMSECSIQGGMRLIRPLLSCTRKEIEGYAFAWKIGYRTDSTNAHSDYKRNRIRNEVFPHFENINPSFVRTINREMSYFSDVNDIMDEWCAAKVKSLGLEGDVIDINVLKSEKHWRYLLYHILEPYGFHSSVLGSIEDLIASDRTFSGKRFESSSHVLMTGRDRISVVRKDDDPEADGGDPVCVVRGEGIYHFNGRAFSVEVLPLSTGMPLKQPEGVLVMDAAKMSFPFVCRRWNKGDWFVPFGMKGRKKVSDLFADLKYDAVQKNSSVMMVDCRGTLPDEGHIAGVLGVRIDDRYRITERTDKIIRIKLQK